MTNTYETQRKGQLIFALSYAGLAPDIELITTCLDRFSELKPDLLHMLENPGDESWEDDDPRWYGAVHAGYLLLAHRELDALPSFKKILLSQDGRDENLVEWFAMDLHAYGTAAIPMLESVISSEPTYSYGTSATIDILQDIMLEHPEERERITEIFRNALPPLNQIGEPVIPQYEWKKLVNRKMFWSFLALALAKLHDEVSQPQIEALYDQDMIDCSVMGDKTEYRKHLSGVYGERIYKPKPFDIMKRYEEMHAQAAEPENKFPGGFDPANLTEEQKALISQMNPSGSFLGDLAGKGSSKKGRGGGGGTTKMSVTFVHDKPKVGRNDPCPCGSGKKYKHCCGKK